MGGYVPNPVPLAAVKVVAYSLFGWRVARRSPRAGNPIVFGVVRVLTGWVVGLAFLPLLARLSGPRADWLAYLAFLVPRFALWAILIHAWFRPRGVAALAMWSILGVVLSSAIDLAFLRVYEGVSWLRIGVC